MFTKGDMVYADAYKYLRHKNKNIIALSFKGSADDFEEVEMTLPIEVETDGDMLFLKDGNLLSFRREWSMRRLKNVS